MSFLGEHQNEACITPAFGLRASIYTIFLFSAGPRVVTIKLWPWW